MVIKTDRGGNSLTAAAKKPEARTDNAVELTQRQSVVSFFGTKHFNRLPDQEIKKMEKILKADPYLNGGRGQEGDKVLVASKAELIGLIERYSNGVLHDGSRIKPLSPEGKKAFEALAKWFVAYRNSFPDPSETEPLANHLDYLKLTKNKEMKWGICINTDKKTGEVISAFSGQALKVEVTVDGVKENLKFAWGEHIFADKSLRGSGLGRQTVAAFEKQMTKNFGKVDPVVIEVDNPYGILDRKDRKNKAYFDHGNIEKQRALWTDPEGQNMAMNPFERIRVWHKLGFQLLAVKRGDLNEGNNTVAFPYNQVPLDKGADPCETIFLAVRITDPKLKAKIESGKMDASAINAMYAAMQETVTSGFKRDPAFKASQEEIKRLVGGANAKVELVDFLSEDRKTLNPKALEIMQRTADSKLTEERLKAS